MFKLKREYCVPIATALMAFFWGWVAGKTATTYGETGAIEFQFAVVIACIPILMGAVIAFGRSLQRERLVSHSLRQEQLALHTHCIFSMTDRDHLLSEVNETLLQLTGYAKEDLIGKLAGIMYFEEDQQVFNSIRSHVSGGNTWSGETRIKCKDGSALWTRATVMPRHDLNGQLTGTLSVRTDITATKIAASEREFSQAMHKFSDDVYVFEPGTYQFIYMNERAMQRLGWDEATYTKKSLHDAEPRFDAKRFDALVACLLDGSTDRIEMQVTLGSTPHDATIQLIRPEVGSPRFVTIFRDVSERIEAERIKDEFISTVSHELRSPLTSVKGALGLALSGAVGELPSKASSLLNIAHRNVDRLVLIVNDILELEKIAAGEMDFDIATRDLCELVSDAVVSNASGASRFDVTIKAEGTSEPALADFDQDRMMQVLTNLISNAVKFSDPGGEVSVMISSDDVSRIIAVSDRGAGIPEDALKTIFDRFTQAENQTARAGKGTGLGLSVVKAIVERHGGTVSIESTVGKGTVVQVCLPKAKALEGQLPTAMRA